MIIGKIKSNVCALYCIPISFSLPFVYYFLSEVPHFRYTDGSTYLKETLERTGK